MQPILIPENLKKAREALGITRVEAARRMNIPQSSYVRYEKGTRKPTHATITQMVQVLGTSVDYLTGQKNKSEQQSIVLDRKEDKVLFEIAEGARNLDEEKLSKLLFAYYELAGIKKK